MGKKGNQRRKEEKKAKKQAQKAATKALYASYRDSGRNSKSKRAVKSSKSKGTPIIEHPDGHCGNYACNRCMPGYPPLTGEKRKKKKKKANKKKSPTVTVNVTVGTVKAPKPMW